MNEATCAQCGMALRHAAEFHPYRACELFAESHNGGDVRAVLRAEFPKQADRHVVTGELLVSAKT
jgi:proteasome lid subunit RPN8/RPN11